MPKLVHRGEAKVGHEFEVLVHFECRVTHGSAFLYLTGMGPLLLNEPVEIYKY